ncbi:phosphatidate cytidylyltransferase [Mycoplasma phocoenae]|uniref:Phosphatidate cytidylyltransferase n=2 Tax=Mycoplasma phocoenae TaxID=754517 RepID=A0A858U5C7_9MOLU|nr:phosphatidate cytidylyltransferase [Mycoplasma phocoenae]
MLFLELIVIFVDTCGYFGGKFFGKKIIKKNLAPKISPKKTWEGAFFSVTLSIVAIFIFGYAMYFWTKETSTLIFDNIIQCVLAAFVLPPLAICGDLWFSALKRNFKIKDFSNLINGHGGIMDRFDSAASISIWLILIIAFI